MWRVWEKGELHTGFWWGDLMEGDSLDDLGVNGRIILKCILKKWEVGMDFIDLPQESNRWRALVNAVMNLHVP
jgi:hypothetical protein